MPTLHGSTTRFVRELPGDPGDGDRARARCTARCYSRVEPTPVARAAAGRAFARGRRAARLRREPTSPRPSSPRCSAATRCSPGMQPYAASYGGHQFGHWAGQLGDGRAITLGEVRQRAPASAGSCSSRAPARRRTRARADGRAVLRSSMREFLCSEAMHHLGVPTTRALCLVATGEHGGARHVLRRPSAAPSPARSCAASRPSFMRFGNFELRASRGEIDAAASSWPTSRIAPRFPGARRAVDASAVRATGSTRSAQRTARMIGALDARRLRARRDEHRQHVDPRPDDRLRPVRLARRLRSRLDAEHHRRARPPLPLRPAAADRATGTWRGSRSALAPLFDDPSSRCRRACSATPTRSSPPIATTSPRKLGLRRVPRRRRRADAGAAGAAAGGARST